MRGRKRWIAFGRSAQGTLVLNDRARSALIEKGSSLLPVGIIEVQGQFEPGALLSLRDTAGEYARGLTNYSADDLRRIAGLHSSQIAHALERADFKEAIHRDNLTVIEEKSEVRSQKSERIVRM